MTAKAKEAPSTPSTDRIEKRVELRAPRSRVWRAIANAEEFGTWFRMNIDGEFAEGRTVRGKVTIPGYEHVTVDMRIERVQPERYFAYRWHPAAIDPARNYSAEPMTLVEFKLEEAEGGSVLTIVESGFDKIPLDRRSEAFRLNEGGWAGQIGHITRHVA